MYLRQKDYQVVYNVTARQINQGSFTAGFLICYSINNIDRYILKHRATSEIVSVALLVSSGSVVIGMSNNVEGNQQFFKGKNYAPMNDLPIPFDK